MLTIKQLIERKAGIGGSDLAGILNISKWKTPLEVYIDKNTPDVLTMDNEKMDAKRRGSLLEPLVKVLFERDFCKNIRVNKAMQKHEKNPHLIANIDGFIQEEKALVEIKTASIFRKQEFGDILTDYIPNDYLAQCHHYLNVFPNMNIVYVPVLFGDDSFLKLLALDVYNLGVSDTLKKMDDLNIDLKISLFIVERKKELGEILKDKASHFWFEHVKKMAPPPCKSEEDIFYLFPKAKEGKTIEADEEILRLKDLLDEKDILISKAEEEKKTLKIQIKSKMEDAEQVILPSGKKINWKNVFTSRPNLSKLKSLVPSAFAECIETNHSRRFTY